MADKTEKKARAKKDPNAPKAPRKPRVKANMSTDGLDFATALKALGGTPTWISSAGSFDDASTWKPTQKGEELVGVHAGVLEKGVNQKYYKVAYGLEDDGTTPKIHTIKAGMGNKRLGTISAGKPVRVVYNGEVTSTSSEEGVEKTRTYRDFLVFQTAL